MYSSTTERSDPSSFNARASWLADKPVLGNVFLTHTKIRHTGWLVPAVVFNSDFTLDLFWQWVHGLLPEVEYANKAGSALVNILPTVFRWVLPCLSQDIFGCSVQHIHNHSEICSRDDAVILILLCAANV